MLQGWLALRPRRAGEAMSTPKPGSPATWADMVALDIVTELRRCRIVVRDHEEYVCELIRAMLESSAVCDVLLAAEELAAADDAWSSSEDDPLKLSRVKSAYEALRAALSRVDEPTRERAGGE